MGVPLWKRALVVALLAYNWAGLLTALRARGNAFLAPPGVGPPQLSARDDALKPADGGSPRLQFTADLHASSVMSSIDLLVRNSPRCTWRRCTRSHVDLPRLIDGHVAVQFLSVFTTLPVTSTLLHWPCTAGNSLPALLSNVLCRPQNGAALLSLLQGLPPWQIHSAPARLEHAFARTWAISARSSGALQVLTSKDELELYIVQRSLCTTHRTGCRYSASILGIEGVDALAHMADGDAASAADEVFELGVRTVALHNTGHNAAGGSRHGEATGGDALTAWGRDLVRRLQELGVLVDLTHSSDALIREVLAMNLTRPLALTHIVPASAASRCSFAGGALGRQPGVGAEQYPAPAVVADTLLRDVAAAGGVIGMSFAACVGANGSAVGPWAHDPVSGVAADIAALVALVGADRVALGSDWDGGIVIPDALDATGSPLLQEALRTQGLTAEQVDQVMGGTALQLLRDTLPSDLEMAETAARGVASRRVTTIGEDGTTYDVWL